MSLTFMFIFIPGTEFLAFFFRSVPRFSTFCSNAHATARKRGANFEEFQFWPQFTFVVDRDEDDDVDVNTGLGLGRASCV